MAADWEAAAEERRCEVSGQNRVHVWPLKVVATKSRFAESGFFVLRQIGRGSYATDLADWLNEQRLRKMEKGARR